MSSDEKYLATATDMHTLKSFMNDIAASAQTVNKILNSMQEGSTVDGEFMRAAEEVKF